MDFHLTNNGVVTMADVVTTATAIIAAWVAIRQKSKDDQIKDRDNHITWLQQKLDECRGTDNAKR